jgi:C4-dicarboxylate transporter DctQ subunit
MSRFNLVLAIISGILVTIIGFLAVFEAVMRGLFNSPTSWGSDVSQYLLIWAIFLGTSYSLQEKGHVAVDFIRDAVANAGWLKVRYVLAIIGYLFCLVVIIVLLWQGYDTWIRAIAVNKLTTANLQIPIAYLYTAIVFGSICMLTTAFCIIIDLIGGGKKYL